MTRISPRSRIGLLTNVLCLDRGFRSSIERHLSGSVVRLLAPEHGLWGNYPAGEWVPDGVDPRTQLPVISLHGPRFAPEPAHLADLDLLIIELPHLPVRAYTFAATALKTIEVAGRLGLPVHLYDRPNPLGRTLEGGLIDPQECSLVAPYPVPLRYGLSLGELAELYCEEQGLPAPKRIPQSGPPFWVAPSPNLPTLESALAYAGTVLIEGTNLSEGRGTTRPFTLIGAPWLDPWPLAEHLNAQRFPGLWVRPTFFLPQASKYAQTPCGGIELHIFDRDAFHALPPTLEVLAWARRHAEFTVLPSLSRLAGSQLVEWLKDERPDPRAILAEWEDEQATFRRRASRFFQ